MCVPAEGWNDIQFAAIDSIGIDMAPRRDHTLAWGYFFILFMILGKPCGPRQTAIQQLSCPECFRAALHFTSATW